MTHTDWTPVNSSFIKSAHYDPDSRKLSVEMASGAKYSHDDVGADKHAAFIGAASPGSFYNAKIRSNHPGRKL